MKVTLNSITSGFAGITALNDNFDAIATAIENTVSRDGTTPNTMGADLDMNGHRILNALAQAGDGFIWTGGWVTATSYAVNNLTYSSGNAYICLEAHTSGVFATDLAATKWELFASKGAAGAGTGDMIGSDNLSDLTDAATARTNLGVAIGTQVQAYSAGIPTTLADQTDAEAGSNNTKWMSPLRVAQAIAALGTPFAADAITGIGNGRATDVTISSAGEVTMPLQPAFLANASAAVSNITGDNTTYTVVFDNVVFDRGGDFNTGTGVFTAPVTGIYRLSTAVNLTGLTASHAIHDFTINTSNRDYSTQDIFFGGACPYSNERSIVLSVLADMDAGDTAKVKINIRSGTKVVGHYGGGSANYTHFCGELVA